MTHLPALSDLTFADESTLVDGLIASARLSDMETQRIQATATELV
jgi:hypothetical protein